MTTLAPAAPHACSIAHFETPLGLMRGVATANALVALGFVESAATDEPRTEACASAETLLRTLKSELAAYFRRDLRDFSVPCDSPGTPFFRKAWRELQTIPYGTTTTYAALARRLGNPSATRAVGAANARNPIAILVPCHRVIGSSGAMTGYAAGLERKRALLQIEELPALFSTR